MENTTSTTENKASNNDTGITILESLCINCQENGETRMLLVNIPFYREVVVSSFECPSCHFKNSEVQSFAEHQDYGIEFKCKLYTKEDLSRRLVKSEYGVIKIEQLGLEIPAETQKGKLSTIEGFIQNTYEGIKYMLENGCYDSAPKETIDKLSDYLDKLSAAMEGNILPLDIHLRDPSGNSHIENPHAPNKDYNLHVTYFPRTKEDFVAMGYAEEDAIKTIEQDFKEKGIRPEYRPINKINKRNFEVFKSDSTISKNLLDLTDGLKYDDNLVDNKNFVAIESLCSSCYQPGFLKHCFIEIPFFKEIIISCFSCDHCTSKFVDVKGGGGISDKATKITLQVKCAADLNRDMFKSDSASLSIPELEFECSYGSFGGMFTTVEGMLFKIEESITKNPFSYGDSTDSSVFNEFLQKLEKLKQGEPFTMILDDPLSNSFIFPLDETKETDEQIERIVYERTEEQNDDLGITDMKTEDY